MEYVYEGVEMRGRNVNIPTQLIIQKTALSFSILAL